jgi:hypothetical protein
MTVSDCNLNKGQNNIYKGQSIALLNSHNGAVQRDHVFERVFSKRFVYLH